jgi:hypothetical protein
LHLILDHDGYLPSFAVVTEGNVSGVKMTRRLLLDPGTMVADDNGYNDYSLFGKWTAQVVFFVIRMKNNTLCMVVKEQEIPKNGHIPKDEIIRLAGTKAGEKCPHHLRRVEVYNPEKDEILVFVNMKLIATNTAVLYENRWLVELFF